MTSIRPTPDPASLPLPDTGTLRGELALNKLAALMPSADVTQTGARSTPDSNLRGGALNGVAAPLPDSSKATANATPGSTRETLSFAARTILDLLGRSDAPPPRAARPLLPAPPAGNAAQAALPVALARLVDRSGLFYESHLAQWVSGARTLESVRAEPQAALGRQPQDNDGMPGRAAPGTPLLPAPGDSALTALMRAVAGRAGAAAGSTVPETVRPEADADLVSGTPGDARAGGNAGHAAAAQPAQAAQSNQSATAPGRPHAPEGQPRSASAPATQAYREMAQAAAPQPETHRSSWPAPAAPTPEAASAGPVVHPAAEGFVRQQLELLASQHFRWVGEAWPDTRMAWEIYRPAVEEDGSARDTHTQAWTTRLLIGLPQLGTIEVRLSLAGGRLDARIGATEQDAVARMDEARAGLRARLAASGIALAQLAIDTGNSNAQGVGT